MKRKRADCIVTGVIVLLMCAVPFLAQQILGHETWNTANVATNTASILANQFIGILTDTNTGTATLTVDTPANMCALVPFVNSQNAQNYHYKFYLKNSSSSSGTVQLAGNGGSNIIGTGTAAAGHVRAFEVVFAACPPGTTGTVQFYSLTQSAF